MLKPFLFPGLVCCVLFVTSSVAFAVGPDPIPLWPAGVPGGADAPAGERAELLIYPADKETANGACVVILPGGGYAGLAIDHEGQQPARWFNSIGVTGVVVKYRRGGKFRHPAPLDDAQQAIRYVRAHAAELEIDPHRVGVMGFSAGGHLASTVSTHYDLGDANSDDLLLKQSCRPDFAILCYPVISLKESFAHSGSRNNLLGPDPSAELLESLSNETQVTGETPPTFLFHTSEDSVVPVRNALVYYESLVREGVPAELHIYQRGPHGMGLAPGDPIVGTWTSRLKDWLQLQGVFVEKVTRAPVSGKVEVGGKPIPWGTICFSPVDTNAPTSFTMIRNGNYSFEEANRPVVGEHTVSIYSLGDFQLSPTVEDSKHNGHDREIVVTVTSKKNVIDLQLDN